jgi:hypothetical protein
MKMVCNYLDCYRDDCLIESEYMTDYTGEELTMDNDSVKDKNVKADIDFWDLIPPEDKLFIIFPGTFMVEGSMEYAEKVAEQMCLDEGDRATIMVVSRQSLRNIIEAVNQGVVFRTPEERG